jgi:tRNA U55 pseudouridine synthase TruB
MNNPFNKIEQDEFGRYHGIVLVNKPIGYSSHDIVNILRRKYQTKKIGHAGALDPFASGLLICVVGKATKYQDEFLLMDKTYEAEVLLGIQTDSGDTEGKPLNYELLIRNYELEQVQQALDNFKPEYEQYVPVFSSVKVDGQKLRVLARSWNSFEIFYGDDVKKVSFQSGDKSKVIDLPRKSVKIYEAEVLGLSEIEVKFSEDESFKYNRGKNEINVPKSLDKLVDVADLPAASRSQHLQVAKIRVSCSKGTYIRQFAEDLGENLGVPAMLISLKRTRVGEFKLEEAEEISSTNI